MENKVCKKCGKEKELKEYSFDNKQQRHYSWCKNCVRNKSKEFYEKNKDKQLKKFKEQSKKIKEIINSFKEGKNCKKCGYSKCLEALDFHHLDPSIKFFGIGDFGRMKGFNKIEQLLKEIEKCVLFCSNCHREFHYLEKISNITIEQYLNSPDI